MDLTNATFNFITTINSTKSVQLDGTLFPSMREISITSRDFDSYAECVRSSRGMLEDLLRLIDEEGLTFKVGAEVNPIISGTQTISKDWERDEISRFWLYDKSMEGTGTIVAISCSKIFTTGTKSATHIN